MFLVTVLQTLSEKYGNRSTSESKCGIQIQEKCDDFTVDNHRFATAVSHGKKQEDKVISWQE